MYILNIKLSVKHKTILYFLRKSLNVSFITSTISFKYLYILEYYNITLHKLHSIYRINYLNFPLNTFHKCIDTDFLIPINFKRTAY